MVIADWGFKVGKTLDNLCITKVQVVSIFKDHLGTGINNKQWSIA